MESTLSDGQLILAISRRSYKHNKIVLAEINGLEVVKRLNIKQGKYSLIGDNKSAHHNVDNISKRALKAEVIWPIKLTKN